MEFFTTAVDSLSVVVIALGGGLGCYGIVNLFEAYGADNPAAKSQGIKQLCAGAGIALVGMTLVPELASLFT